MATAHAPRTPDHPQNSPSRLGRERREAAVFGVSVMVVAVTWILLGFRPGASVMGNDGPQYFLPMLSVLSHAGGNWQAMLYRPEYFGGTNILGLYGLLPVSILLAKLGASPVWNLNLSLFFVQASLAYFAVQGARRFAGTEGDVIDRRFLVVTCGIVWISAFSTVIAWRIESGHLYYMTALAAVQAMLTVWVSAVRGRLGAFMLLLALVTLVQAFCVQGFQILVYAMVFCAPLVIAMAMDLARAHSWRGTLWPMVTCVAGIVVALAIAAPIFIEMLAFALGGDSPRALGGHAVVTYSYFTGTWRENLSALFWFNQGLSRLPGYQLLEVYYGIGPLLLLVAVPIVRRQWAVVAALATSLVLCMAFVTNEQPLSGLLVHLPLVADYRVPVRVFMPLALVWNMMALGYLLRERGELAPLPGPRWWPLLGVVVAAAVGIILPVAAKEAFVWLLVCGLAYLVLSRRPGVIHVAAVLVFMNLVAFARHVHMVGNAARTLANNRQLGRQVLAAKPQLAGPLVRADVDASTFGFDLSPVGGVTAITGYGFPHRRFSILMHDLVNARYSPTRTFFNATSRTPAFRVAQQLYNIRYRLSLEKNHVVIDDLAGTPGPVWASERRQWVDNQHHLDDILKLKLAAPGWTATQYEDSDVADPGRRFDCSNVTFGGPRRGAQSGRLDIPVNGTTSGDCPVTVAMTWSGNLQGEAVTPGGTVNLSLYPAYGALTGLLLPPGTRELGIYSARQDAALGDGLWEAGLLGGLALLWLGRRDGAT